MPGICMKAAIAGIPEAEVGIGNAYARGHGVSQDDQQAVHWYRLAAEHGYVDAAWNMAVAYELGLGVRPDIDQAIQWYCTAGLEGDQDAQWHLVSVYYKWGTRDGQNKVLYWLSVLKQEGNPSAAILYRLMNIT